MLLRRHHKPVDLLDLPAQTAKKAVWVAYAKQEGVPVEDLTRDEIIALFPVESAETSEVTPEEIPVEEITVEASDEPVAEGSTETE